MRSKAIAFEAGNNLLAGDLYLGDRAGPLGAVVLHPHPLYGGDRRNIVTVALARALADAGVAAFCFDFRGAGGSQGVHGGGKAEVDDVEAAIVELKKTVPDIESVALVGYSFGAYVASLAAGRLSPAAIVCVAPPQAMFPCDALAGYGGPLLLIAGDNDQFAPAESVMELGAATGARCEFIHGGDHFLAGRESVAARLAVEFLLRETRR